VDGSLVGLQVGIFGAVLLGCMLDSARTRVGCLRQELAVSMRFKVYSLNTLDSVSGGEGFLE
jgi:hypothetical protein